MKRIHPTSLCILFGALVSFEGCDPGVWANATVPVVSPIDSVCAKTVLERLFGPPTIRQHFVKRIGADAPSLWLYFGKASYTLYFPDTGSAKVGASQMIALGHHAPHATADSVSRDLGQTLLSVRDACGGKAPRGATEILFN